MNYAQGRSIDRRQQRLILDEVEAAARAAGGGGVVVFDLDSTLYDNRPRQARILAEYGEAHGVTALCGLSPERLGSWSLADAMRAAGVEEPVVQQHRAAVKRFWGARFFTSEYCLLDEPLAGARDYAVAVRATGVQVAYVTGRDTGMGEGTRRCFARDGFPLPDGSAVHLLLKPSGGEGDDDWKVTAGARVAALGRVVAAFDNEPAHINSYRARFPEARCVRLATDDSGREVPLAPGVVSIADFAR